MQESTVFTERNRPWISPSKPTLLIEQIKRKGSGMAHNDGAGMRSERHAERVSGQWSRSSSLSEKPHLRNSINLFEGPPRTEPSRVTLRAPHALACVMRTPFMLRMFLSCLLSLEIHSARTSTRILHRHPREHLHPRGSSRDSRI